LNARILVVDDEKNILVLFKKILTAETLRQATGETPETIPDKSIEIHTALNGESAWSMIQTADYDLIISDLAMGEMNGIALLRHVKSYRPEIPFIILTGVGTIEDAVQAIKLGAYDYVTKPFQQDELLLTIKKALDYGRLNYEVRRLREQISEKDGVGFNQIIGKSKSMTKIFELIRVVAKSDSTVLIEGESGTGKELVARAIHHESLRRNQPFVAIDCGAIPETLLESELFGYVRGAFTGAIADKKGIFREADKGTLFLDEIADISLSTQAKLLRALQEREIRPLGSTQGIKFDVRILAATNKPLYQHINAGRFREDLYYRLAVITLKMPPLRDRKEDIPLIVNYFLEKYTQLNHKPPMRIADRVMEHLLEYEWPGNIRELENIIERAVVITSGDVIESDILPEQYMVKMKTTAYAQASAEGRYDALAFGAETPQRFILTDEQNQYVKTLLKQNLSLKEIMSQTSGPLEKAVILHTLSEVLGNRAEAARRLGISRPALYSKMKDYGIE